MQDYGTRLERVYQWLADHPDDAVDLTRLADVACLSRYHFHRVYRAMRGETVAETVRRLRLHRAAVELINRELPITRVARRAGYTSQEGLRARSKQLTECRRPATERRSFP